MGAGIWSKWEIIPINKIIKMKNYILLLSLFTLSAFAQERFELKGHGFTFERPDGWLTAEDRAFRENIEKFGWTEKQAEELKNQSSTANVTAFYKYDSKTYRGIIPTLNLTTGPNPTKTFAQFKQMVANSHAQFKKVLNDFKVVSEAKEMVVDGRKAIMETTSYMLNGPDGPTMIKSCMLCFTKDKYYYTLSLVEEAGKEDNMVIFDQVIKTIRIGDKSVSKK